MGRDLTAQAGKLHRALEPFFTEASGLPLNSTKQVAISFRSFQRRRWARSRGGSGAGAWRFLVARLPIDRRGDVPRADAVLAEPGWERPSHPPIPQPPR